MEHARGDRASCVEDDLGKEEHQQERHQVALLGRHVAGDAERQEAGEQRCGEHADERQRPQEHHGDAEHPAGHLLRLALLAAFEQLDERGDEHGRERARSDQLEDDVGDRVRRLEGVPEVGGAQDRGDDEDPGKPHQARQRRDDRDPHRRTNGAGRLGHDGGGSTELAPSACPYWPGSAMPMSRRVNTVAASPANVWLSSTVL